MGSSQERPLPRGWRWSEEFRALYPGTPLEPGSHLGIRIVRHVSYIFAGQALSDQVF